MLFAENFSNYTFSKSSKQADLAVEALTTAVDFSSADDHYRPYVSVLRRDQTLAVILVICRHASFGLRNHEIISYGTLKVNYERTRDKSGKQHKSWTNGRPGRHRDVSGTDPRKSGLSRENWDGWSPYCSLLLSEESKL
jgi:hypothetical protein